MGAVPQVLVGAPPPTEMFTVPICIEGVPVPATEICGLEPFDTGGVPPLVAPPKSLVENSGPAPDAIKPWLPPPAVR